MDLRKVIKELYVAWPTISWRALLQSIDVDGLQASGFGKAGDA